MERHRNMKMTVMKEEVGYIHRLLDRRHSTPGSATWESAKVNKGAEGMGEALLGEMKIL